VLSIEGCADLEEAARLAVQNVVSAEASLPAGRALQLRFALLADGALRLYEGRRRVRAIHLADTTALTVLHDQTAIEDKMRRVFAGGSCRGGDGAAGGAAGGADDAASEAATAEAATDANANANANEKRAGGLFGGGFFKSPTDILGGMKAGVVHAFADVKTAGETVVSSIEKTNAAAVASIDKHANILGGGASFALRPSRRSRRCAPSVPQNARLTPPTPDPPRTRVALSKSIGQRVVARRMPLRCYGFQLSTTQEGGGLTLLLRSEAERDLWIERLRHALPFSVAGSARHNPNRTLHAARLIQRRFRARKHARERAAMAAASPARGAAGESAAGLLRSLQHELLERTCDLALVVARAAAAAAIAASRAHGAAHAIARAAEMLVPLGAPSRAIELPLAAVLMLRGMAQMGSLTRKQIAAQVAKSSASGSAAGVGALAPLREGGFYFMYRYISRESCSQFDSLPLPSLTKPPPLHATALAPAAAAVASPSASCSAARVRRTRRRTRRRSAAPRRAPNCAS
jgi:hypothetical protein